MKANYLEIMKRICEKEIDELNVEKLKQYISNDKYYKLPMLISFISLIISICAFFKK